MDRMDETHCKQHELRLQPEPCSGDFLHSFVQPDGMEGGDRSAGAR